MTDIIKALEGLEDGIEGMGHGAMWEETMRLHLSTVRKWKEWAAMTIVDQDAELAEKDTEIARLHENLERMKGPQYWAKLVRTSVQEENASQKTEIARLTAALEEIVNFPAQGITAAENSQSEGPWNHPCPRCNPKGREGGE